MARPVIATKLYVPRTRQGLTSRPRLTEQLGRGAEARMTLLSAPAGFGKTTLLADWLAEMSDARRLIAWLSIDAADNEPSSFWTYVTTALTGAVPAIGSTALALLDSAGPTDQLLTTLLNGLAAAPDEVWLILDDYHLIDDPEVVRGVTFVLEHLPPQLHVVLSTRADPDLPLARWRARGELVEIRAADLRFTSTEAAAYLTETVDRPLSEADVDVLEERTEGWIAALQLAALSIRGREDVSDFIARFAGDHRYIVDYLVEEVLAHQPDVVRDFLLQSAVLDRLSGPLCDALTGHAGSTQMITTLERANLFLVPLDDRREWYRYHHLFAEVLRARLLSERPEEVPLLHQRASQWFAHHDLFEQAVGHALAARDVDRAAHLMELAVSSVRRHRQEALMYGWLKALPEDSVRRSPVLSVFYGSMLMATGDPAAVESRLDDAERALAAGSDGLPLPWADTDDLRTLPSTIAMYRAALAQARGDVAGTTEHARRALALAGPLDHLARGGASGFLAFAAWAAGDVSSALETFTQAVDSLHAAGNLVDELSGTVILGDLWLAGGRPGTARRLCVQALDRAETHGTGVARATAELHVALSELDIEVGDLDAATRHLDAAAALADRAAMTESRYRWFVATALLRRAQDDPDSALQHLDQAEELYRPGFFPDIRPVATIRVRLWIAQGRLPEAAAWVRDRGLSPTDEVGYLSEYDHLTLVRLLLAQHRAQHGSGALDQAAGLLDRLHAAAEAGQRAGSLFEIRLLQALAQDAGGRRPQALSTLARALTLAPEPEGYVRLFRNEGAPMHGLLRDARLVGAPGKHVRCVLRLGAATKTRTDGGRHSLAQTAAASLSERELQVLRLLDTELSGPEIARELFVSHNTVRTHTKHIFTKLDVTNRRAAISRAQEHGLI